MENIAQPVIMYPVTVYRAVLVPADGGPPGEESEWVRHEDHIAVMKRLQAEVERLADLARAADEHRLEVIRWAAAKAAGQTNEEVPPPGR